MVACDNRSVRQLAAIPARRAADSGEHRNETHLKARGSIGCPHHFLSRPGGSGLWSDARLHAFRRSGVGHLDHVRKANPFYVEDGTVFAVNSDDLVVDGASVADIICYF